METFWFVVRIIGWAAIVYTLLDLVWAIRTWVRSKAIANTANAIAVLRDSGQCVVADKLKMPSI